MIQPGFFTIDERLAQLSKLGDPLERLAGTIPWEEFRALLQGVHAKERKPTPGANPMIQC